MLFGSGLSLIQIAVSSDSGAEEAPEGFAFVVDGNEDNIVDGNGDFLIAKEI